ncbi:F-box protein 7-like isoform X2 [Solanum tuberosum]|uniref:F-box protein 7-like isoform X2 n=1 Tax=Solanum tuberosum TaxID=4113 RepID=UPI00073A2F0B|nr:PREDICTED: F-box protein 7-like isoform X2 [Solanum tuberosum]XP_015161278.1 PREDICTED: F-box protein 7-like isoform X2 [Solanum tuberosum]
MPNFSCSSVCSIDDYIVELAVELETTAQLRDSQFIFPQRSWLDLYGINVRPVAHFGSASSKQFLDPALIHQVLHDELLFEVCYYFYMRFYPSGRFLYKNSSQKVKDVAKYLNFRGSKASCVFKGSYPLSEDKTAYCLLICWLKLLFCTRECVQLYCDSA